jgi:ferrous iron transport protein A
MVDSKLNLKLSSLSELQPGPKALQIQSFCGEEKTIERLKELGLHQGLKIVFQSRMPFSGPSLIRFGATVLALRQEEAACLQVK